MARVLHLSEYTKGGVETHLNEVLAHQSESHDIYLMASEYNSNRETLRISPDRLILYRYRRSPKYFLPAARAIRQTVRELEPDIVHVHGTFAGAFLRTLLLFKRKRPAIVYCSHGWAFLMDTPRWRRKLYAMAEKLLALRTDVIIHISDYEYEAALKFGLPSNKSVVVHNGVSSAPPASQEPFRLAKDEINLLFVGRFDRQKGFDRLLEVFNEHRFENVRLYLVGEAVLSQSEYRYPDNAVRVGWVDHSEIDRYMKACDALIVPSRWEGFGLVAIEALRNRKPVIASKRGALPEIIEHGVNGYLFDFDDKEQLAGIVRSLDKRELETLGQAGERLFREKFHADRMNRQIERLYENVLQTAGDRVSVTVKKYV
jgi:Glycosyltransferase